MVQVSSDILALTSEALVLVQAGRVGFANAAAKKLLGSECEGERIAELLPAEIVCAQGSGFIADTLIKGKRCIVRVTKHEGMQAIFLAEPKGEPVMLSEAFIYSMRNNLMTVCMTTELCRTRAEDIGDDALRAGVATMSQSYFRMTRLLENLSAAKSMLSDGIRFVPVRVSLTEICKSIVGRAGMLCREPEVSYDGGDAEHIIEADPALIELMLLNLISNSLVHAEGCTRVALRIMDAGENVILSVTDNGCGITSEELPSVFDRYTHAFTLSGMGDGAGLGMTVARGVAEKHGGTLLLESRTGIGTTVRVSLKKSQGLTAALGAPAEHYNADNISVITGLADFLPEQSFKEKYLD